MRSFRSVVFCCIIGLWISALAGLWWKIYLDDREAAKITIIDPGLGAWEIDDATKSAYDAIGGRFGKFRSCDGTYLWVGHEPGHLPGFTFQIIPRRSVPVVNVAFGLTFEDSDFADDDIATLTHLKNLVFLNVRKTKVTDVGLAKVKCALPQCTIMR